MPLLNLLCGWKQTTKKQREKHLIRNKNEEKLPGPCSLAYLEKKPQDHVETEAEQHVSLSTIYYSKES